MNKIGFQNFRRFKNFPELEYGGITLLVGKNNSGKSTLVKAIMLFYEYLLSCNVKQFNFSGDKLEDTNIVTFDRALNINANKNGEKIIKFEFEISQTQFSVELSGTENSTKADVYNLTIISIEGYKIEIKPQVETITVSKANSEVENKIENNSISEEINTLQSLIKSDKIKKSSKEYLEAVDRLNSLIDKHKTDENQDVILNNDQFELTTHYSDSNSIFDIIEEFISENTSKYFLSTGRENPIDNEVDFYYDEKVDDYRAFYELRYDLSNLNSFLKIDFEEIEYYYLGASSHKQSALFAIRDKSNGLAQAIHEYKQLGIDKATGSAAYLFVKKWMSEQFFDIGDELEITMHAGEAYEVRVSKRGVSVALADKGMGSIQAILLILRLACIIYKRSVDDKGDKENPFIQMDKILNKDKTFIIIEEPELNLHPAMQSKLADLFHDVYSKFNIQLIVETHSEYLIRKTQLIVKENEYEVIPNENPFTVVYFDSNEDKQWIMEYREDGKFANEFGTGFYDESAMLTLNLL
jgi:predicted ATPase